MKNHSLHPEQTMPEKTMENHFTAYKKEIEKEVHAAQKKIASESREREYVPLERYPLFALQEKIRSALAEKFPESSVVPHLELVSPPEHIAGDFAINIIPVAREAKEKPDAAATTAGGILKEAGISEVKEATPAGGYLNISLDRPKFYGETIAAVHALGEHYGESDVNARKIALIEYSSPNIAKPIGVGHLRSTIIGQAIVNLDSATGYTTIRENYLGDWGTQFGKVIYAYRAWAKTHEDEPTVSDLKNLYVRFHEESAEDEAMEDEARRIFAQLEAGDPEIMALWKKFRDMSIKNFQETYQRFGIDFDIYPGESYFADDAQRLIDKALERDIAKKVEEEGKEVVKVESLPGLKPFPIRKSDGSTLYVSRELAALAFRVKEFRPQEIVSVVGQEQELYLRQAHTLAKTMGIIPNDVRVTHVGFGMVLTDGKKMSTRKGTLVELGDLLSQSVEKSRAIMKEKNPDLSEKELDDISEIVGVGAVIYNDLKQSRTHNISFDWKRMLDFEGGSAAYLQYTYVRIRSIIRKLEEEKKYAKATADVVFEKDSEFALAKKMAFFPKIILDAQKDAQPHVIATYLEELAQLFNTFYGEVSIIKTEDDGLRASRIALIESVALVIKKGLSLLNIKVPEKM